MGLSDLVRIKLKNLTNNLKWVYRQLGDSKCILYNMYTVYKLYNIIIKLWASLRIEAFWTYKNHLYTFNTDLLLTYYWNENERLFDEKF